MKLLLFICCALIVTVSVTKQQETCSPSVVGSIRLQELGNTTNAVVGSVEICSCIVDVPCRWITICSEGWTNETARYTCDNIQPSYKEGTAIEMILTILPRPSLNISACASVFPNCSDAPIQTCTNVAAVICTRTRTEIPCETPLTTQIPTTSETPPTVKPQDLCSPSVVGSIRLQEMGNTPNAVVGSVEMCWCVADNTECAWLAICSEGWTNETARYTCDNIQPSYKEGTAIATSLSIPPRSYLNISACASVYPNCSDAPMQTCTNVAGVICTRTEILCDTPSTTQYPTTNETPPTSTEQLPDCDPCPVYIIVLGVLALLLLILLIAVVIGWLCTCGAKQKEE